ncbi:hypothetical protein SY2F82_73950 [Streptomyces sp. Y2F8-2]|nr:hypothetical protein SY2F82_73950 [Streptomyces sp. Y2F8-2]
MHANAGTHKELPRFRAVSAFRFFTRHFGRAVTSTGLMRAVAASPPDARGTHRGIPFGDEEPRQKSQE